METTQFLIITELK